MVLLWFRLLGWVSALCTMRDLGGQAGYFQRIVCDGVWTVAEVSVVLQNQNEDNVWDGDDLLWWDGCKKSL